MGDITLTPETANIVDLKDGATEEQLEQAAKILFESFKENWPEAWPTLEDAMTEVEECTEDEGRIAIAVCDTEGSVIGWVGGVSTYDGEVWELHPLCVAEEHRKKGYGSLLVDSLAGAVAKQGGMTLYLGTDDESGQTSLSGTDIYDDTWMQIKNIQNIRNHPFSFYQRLGFSIVGIVPDANGYGKPDIMMARRVGEIPTE